MEENTINDKKDIYINKINEYTNTNISIDEEKNIYINIKEKKLSLKENENKNKEIEEKELEELLSNKICIGIREDVKVPLINSRILKRGFPSN